MKVRIGDYLSKAEAGALVARSRTFALKVAFWIAWMSGSIWLQHAASGWLLFAAVILLGLAIAHGVELCHQTLHYSGFRSKAANVFFGHLAGAPMLVSFNDYRTSHLRHHRQLGTPKDSEFFDYGNGGLTLGAFLVNLFMVKHYASYLKRCRCIAARILLRRDTVMQPGDGFFVITSLGLLGAASALILFERVDLLLSLSASLFLVAGPVHYLIELPEHYGCDKTTVNVFHNTRSISTNRLVSWYVNGNNYHVEHHLLSCAPLQNAPTLHARLAPHLTHLEGGYVAFYRKLIKGLYRAGHAPGGMSRHDRIAANEN